MNIEDILVSGESVLTGSYDRPQNYAISSGIVNPTGEYKPWDDIHVGSGFGLKEEYLSEKDRLRLSNDRLDFNHLEKAKPEIGLSYFKYSKENFAYEFDRRHLQMPEGAPDITLLDAIKILKNHDMNPDYRPENFFIGQNLHEKYLGRENGLNIENKMERIDSILHQQATQAEGMSYRPELGNKQGLQVTF